MILDCSGAEEPSKKAAFHSTLDIHKADIVHGCELKLCHSMCTCELFFQNNTIFRIDRNINGGGVFVATTDRIMSHEIPDIYTECEMI